MKIGRKFKIVLASVGSLFLMLSPLSFINLIEKSNNNLISDSSVISNELSSNLNNRIYETSNSSLETISNQLGPIVVRTNSIVNYDWYYNDYWTVDLSKYGNSTTVADWEYLQDKNLLYVITDTSYLLKINALTGDVLASASRTASAISAGSNKIAFISYDLELYVWNSFLKGSPIYQVDRNILKVVPNSGIISQSGVFSAINSLRLDVGYNLAVTTSEAISSPTTSITNLTLLFYTDTFQEFAPTTPNVPIAKVQIAIPATPYKNIYSNLFYRTSSQTYILIVANKFYEINLNKQDMGKTTITEFNNLTPPGSNVAFSHINSSFITSNDVIYIKSDSSSIIYTIKSNSTIIEPYLDLKTITNNSEILEIANKLDNKLQIYGVVSVDETLNSSEFLDNAIFLSDPESNKVGGIVNGKSTERFSDSTPTINIKNSASFFVSIPSSITSNSFESAFADPLLGSNVDLIADDLTGSLILKATITKNVWYETRTNLKTTTIYNKKYSLIAAPTKFVFATQSVFGSISNGYFTNRTPSQIDESDFNNFVNQVLPTGSVPSGTFNKVNKFFIITGRDDVAGNIKVKAVVSYENRYNNTISFIVPEMTYKVKTSSQTSYKFEFIEDNSTTIFDLKKFLPSLINPTDRILLERFIKVENSYIPARRVFALTPDDDVGTLTVNVIYNGLDPAIASSYTQIYTGFASNKSATIVFNGENQIDPNPALSPNVKNVTSILGYENYKDVIATDVTPARMTASYSALSLINMGYSPVVTILPSTIAETELGAITIQLDFSIQSESNKKLPSIYKDRFGLTEYKIAQQYTGFLPIGATFGISLLSYSSAPIQTLFKSYSVNSVIPDDKVIETLSLKGFKIEEIVVRGYKWVGEELVFTVFAKSQIYNTVEQTVNFAIDWSVFFASERTKNLIIGVSVALTGLAIISGAIIFYILRKNKIRRLLK